MLTLNLLISNFSIFWCSLYPISRYARKVLLVLHPYLHTAGINIFSACILSNPFIRNKCVGPEDMWVYMHVCTSEVSPLTPSSLTLSEEWFSGGKVLPADILEGSRNGQWWIVKSAVMVTKEVRLCFGMFLLNTALCMHASIKMEGD